MGTYIGREIAAPRPVLFKTVEYSSDQNIPSIPFSVQNIPFSVQTMEEIPVKTDECVVCRVNPRKYVVEPCMHYGLCLSCAEYYKSSVDDARCPLCRVKINSMIRIFDV